MNKVPISNIMINNRKRESYTLDDLIKSISKIGLLNPITLKIISNEKYELVSGFRRLKTAEKLQFTTIDANILDESTNYLHFHADVDLFEHTCEVCDNPITEQHHIIPKHFGGSDNKDNLIRLCPTHHTIFDFLTKMKIFEDNKPLDDEVMGKESKQSWKILKTRSKIMVYERKAILYFENFIEPKLPKFFKPTDHELWVAGKKIVQNLNKQGFSVNDMPNDEYNKQVSKSIKQTRLNNLLHI